MECIVEGCRFLGRQTTLPLYLAMPARGARSSAYRLSPCRISFSHFEPRPLQQYLHIRSRRSTIRIRCNLLISECL